MNDSKIEVKKIYKKCFRECFMNLMKELEMDETSFCEKVLDSEGIDRVDDWLIDGEKDKFRSCLYRYEKYFPLEYINVMEKELGKKSQKDREICHELRKIWRDLEQCKDRIKPFFDMSDDDLFWIANNLEKLLEIPEKSIAFLYYLDLLNDEGKEKVLNEIPYVLQGLNLKINKEKPFNIFFIEKDAYRLNDKVECLLEIENCTKLWEIVSCKDREFCVELWKKYRHMDNLDKRVCSLFNSYNDKNPLKILDEQTVIITIIFFLSRERKYKK